MISNIQFFPKIKIALNLNPLDRFINSKGEFVPHPRVVAYGIGKRRCPGESLARIQLDIFFSGILKKFQIKLSDDDEKPSTDCKPGINLSPWPFKVRFVPWSVKYD